MKKNEFSMEYLKSAISINTHIGCSLDCKYCIVNEFEKNEVKQIHTPQEAVDLLLNSRLFIPNKTPIALNNRSDPLLSNVRESTFELLRLLNEREIYNPKIIISKLPLKDEEISKLDGSLGKNYFFVTYSNLPNRIEKLSHNKQKESLRQLAKRKRFHAIHYWRPLIKGLNDSEPLLREVFNEVSSVCEGSVLSGIRLNKDLAIKISNYGGDISSWDGDNKHKYLPESLLEKVINIRNEIEKDYPLFKHTSCAICSSESMPDYNFHFLNKYKCVPECLNLKVCKINEAPCKEKIELLLNKLGISNKWLYEPDSIKVLGSINEEERSCLSHSLNYPIVADSLYKSPSERSIRR